MWAKRKSDFHTSEEEQDGDGNNMINCSDFE